MVILAILNPKAALFANPFDRIRIWQLEDCEDCSVTCDPPGYPTTKYIKKHEKAFMNPNLTNWEATGYDWPRNELVDGCD